MSWLHSSFSLCVCVWKKYKFFIFSLDNIANAVEALHLTEENVSHSAPDSAIEVEMKAITYTANDYAIPVSFHQMNTDLLDRAATIQNGIHDKLFFVFASNNWLLFLYTEASTTSIGAFAEQTNDPVNNCITGGVSADALPQCRVMLTDCAKELKKPSGCPACRRNFMTKGDQTQHINDNDTFAPYGCSVECPKMLSCLIDSKGLCEKRIYHDHRTQIQYKCRKCPKMYGNNCSLLRHVLAVHLRTRRKRKHLRKVCRSWRKG